MTQYFWIDNAVKLKREQFDDKINVSLKAVVNSLYSIKNNGVNGMELLNPACRPVFSPDSKEIDYVTLDSLLNLEFSNMKITNEYYFGVFKVVGEESKLIFASNENFKKNLRKTNYQASLSCLYNYNEAYFLNLYFPNENSMIFKQMTAGIMLSALFVLIIGFSFFYIIYNSFKQKKISIMKNDFVNNMTHEFKTPISTVSLSAEMLLREPILTNPEKARKYANVILEENQRLKHQVEQVLQIAVIDKGEFRIKKKDVDTHKILSDLIHKVEITVSNRGGAIKTYFAANYPKIWADKMHFTNVLSNLLDNANKYTPDAPIIIVRTKNSKNGIIISIEDNGIGIKSEDQKEIFKQFHRVHTGNLHDVKGFGLGLYYVKLMTEAHGGHVKLTSEWGKGSIFEVYFPFNNDVK
jgi:two-component system phosphate regulon sensor histidine kinase PhoR